MINKQKNKKRERGRTVCLGIDDQTGNMSVQKKTSRQGRYASSCAGGNWQKRRTDG